MAKQTQQMQTPQKSDFEKRVDEQVNKAMKKIELEQNKKNMENSKKEFLAKQQELAETAAEIIMEYGRENYLSQILMTFLDVSIQMEGAIKTMQSVSKAMMCIGQAMGCMDDILQSYQLVLEGSMEHKYGYFQRRKNKKRLKKAIANNAGRMLQICDSLVGSQELAMSIASSLERASKKMQALMQKNQKKQQKLRAKQNGASGAPSVNSSKAEEMVNRIVAAKNGGGSAPETQSAGGAELGGSVGGADKPQAPSAGGVNDSGIDDII